MTYKMGSNSGSFSDNNIHEINFFDNNIESISFSGGGYNCVYHIGIVKYIFENPKLFMNTKYLGASGGAGIIAIILCYENDVNKFAIINKLLNEIILMNDRNLKFYEQVAKYSTIIESFIDEERFNKYIKNSNRCHISVTNISFIIPINIIKTKFITYTQFIETLKASACIPFIFDNMIRTIDGISYIDGGLTNNNPILNDNTIKISCINYPLMNAHVYPRVICELKYSFYAPAKNYILNMCDLGYCDIEKYMCTEIII